MPPLKREVSALAAILADPENESRTAEELAALLIGELDDQRAKQARIAVVVRHRWLDTDDYSLAVLGPFGARAQARAREMGEAACAALAHPGDGRAVLVPVYASPRDAWNALKPPPAADLMRAQVARDLEHWSPGLWEPDGSPCPTCCCGLSPGSYCRVHNKQNPEAP